MRIPFPIDPSPIPLHQEPIVQVLSSLKGQGGAFHLHREGVPDMRSQTVHAVCCEGCVLEKGYELATEKKDVMLPCKDRCLSRVSPAVSALLCPVS